MLDNQILAALIMQAGDHFESSYMSVVTACYNGSEVYVRAQEKSAIVERNHQCLTSFSGEMLKIL
jgi:hypothetical protein